MMSPWVLDELNRAHREELLRAGRPFAPPRFLALRPRPSHRSRPSTSPARPFGHPVGRLLHALAHPWPGSPAA